MTTSELAIALTRMETTQEKPEEIKRCLDFCVDYFADLPVVVKHYEKDDIPSVVILNRDTVNVDVLLLGHIDTIPGKPELFEGTVANGKLYGRGTLDMKAFVATSMSVMRDLVKADYPGALALAIVSDEELGGKYGAKYLVEEIGYKADTVLVPDDGEGISRLVQASKHILQLEFTAQGKESHAARPWNGDNAILKLFRTYQKLEQRVGSYPQPPEDMWVNTVSLSELSGGIASNEVPEHATMVVDLRFTPDTTSRTTVMKWIKASLEPGVAYNISMEGFPTVVDPSDPKVSTYIKIVEEVTGSPVVLARHGGGTDGRYFAAAGMRVIVHQGTGGDCQSDTEHVELKTLDQLVDIQTRFILAAYPKSNDTGARKES
jgi:succinyl-diaminopimelate desuccinylase